MVLFRLAPLGAKKKEEKRPFQDAFLPMPIIVG